MTAVRLNGSRAQSITESSLTGGSSGASAIVSNGAKVFLNDTTAGGYGTFVNDTSSANNDLAMSGSTSAVDEWTSNTPKTEFASAATSLDLDAPDTPRFHSGDPADWANVTDYGASTSGGGDDYAGIQAAIDSGKSVVYLPNGSYSLSQTLKIRGNVKLIIGGHSSLGRGSGFPSGQPTVSYEGSAGQTTVMEHFWVNGQVQHNGAGTFAMRHVDITGGYINTASGTGDMFFEDAIVNDGQTNGLPDLHVAHPQRVFARQLNTEFGDGPYIVNDGGTFWAHGLKTEGQTRAIRTINGGTTEILGGFFYPLSTVASGTVLIESIDSRFSGNFQTNFLTFPILVRETRDGVTLDFTHSEALKRGNQALVPLYIGYETNDLSIDVNGVSTALSTPVSYGTVQDGQGGDNTAFTIEDGGAAIRLTGNAWKSTDLNYTVTSDTVLEFTVNATDVGEIVGIALDNDSNPTSGRRAFLAGGSTVGGSNHQAWGWNLSPSYVESSGDATYTVNVGDFFTGVVNKLGFIADDDAGLGSANVKFSNIALFEETGGGGGSVTGDLAVYNFPSGSVASSDAIDGSTASAVASGGGSGYSLSATAVSGRLRVTTTDNNPNSASAKRDNGQYVSFTVDADAGGTLDLAQLSFGTRREGSSPDRVTVYATADDGASFVNVLNSATVNSKSAFDTRTADLSGVAALQGASSVEFRVVFHGGSTGISNGRDDLDAIVVSGTLNPGGSSTETGDLAAFTFGSGSLASSDTIASAATSNLASGGGSGYNVSATAVAGRLRVNTTDNSPNGAAAKRDNGQYVGFSIDADAGKSLSLDAISLGTRRGGNSPDRLTVYASVDGGNTFITLIDNTTVPSQSAFSTKSNSALGSVSALQGVASVAFRIVFHGGNTSISNGIGDLDNLVIVGSVT